MNNDLDPLRLDQASVRRAFERAAATFDAASVLHREVSARMAERLGIVRLAPTSILDAGCGTGEALGELHARYPGAGLLGIDFAFRMISAARARAPARSEHARSLLARLAGSYRDPPIARPQFVCGDLIRLPFRAGSVDLVWSNLVLQWVNEPAEAFAEFHRVLATGGLLSFTTLGPDTLRELRSAFASVDPAVHVHRFIDMHDVGDMLVHAGFADPVMDVETLTLTYADGQSLMRELKALGASNSAAARRRGLTGTRRWAAALTALDRFRSGGRLPASFEVVYGHAWKPEPRRAADGRDIVHFRRPARR